MNLEDLRVFVVVGAAGSLSAGARKLGVSVATAGRRIDALEEALGVPVLRRGRLGVSLSAAGRRLLASAGPAVQKLQEVERLGLALRAGAADPPIRISATEPIVAHVLAPALAPLLADGSLSIELMTATAVADFDRHECDFAVRLFRPVGDRLVGKRMPDIAMGLFASKEYLKGRDPRHLDLANESLLAISQAYGRIAEVQWVSQHGLDASARVVSSSSSALLQAARAGAGIAIAPQFLARGLTRVAAPPMPARQCWVVFHADSRRSPRHRRVLEWIAKTLTSVLR